MIDSEAIGSIACYSLGYELDFAAVLQPDISNESLESSANPCGVKEKTAVSCENDGQRMVGMTGFEPEGEGGSNLLKSVVNENREGVCPYIGPQYLGVDCPDLARIQQSWSALPEHLKAAIVEICRPYSEENKSASSEEDASSSLLV